MTITNKIKAKAKEFGFQKVGITPAAPSANAPFLRSWLDKRYHGEMAWLARAPERRTDPRKIVEGAQSVISLATNYYTEAEPETQSAIQGKISRYAWGDDYHHLIKPRLRRLYEFIQLLIPGVAGRYYVDTGPVMEKAMAQSAGLGWIGKHTNLITEEYGSWVFLSEIILDAPLDYDLPATDQCGHCRLCIDACPTEAIVAPYVLDARRCIPYLTIELRTEIPEDLRPLMDLHLFGCDICQEVCPWNSRSVPSGETAFQPRRQIALPPLDQAAGWDEGKFQQLFRNSAVKRTKWLGFLRNVIVAMGNACEPSFLPLLKQFLIHRDGRIRSHAAWAMGLLQRKARQKAKSRGEVQEL